MCTIAILIDVVPGAAIVLAANRDELYARPTRGPDVLDARTRIVGGVDVLSGGTWLAVRPDGHFAAVTNQLALATPPPGLRSRGLAVMELAAAPDPEAYVAALDPTRYASMNLIWRDGDRVAIAYARREPGTLEVARLARGVHVLCNDRLGAPGFPRGERLARTIEVAIDAANAASGGNGGNRGTAWPALVEPLYRALGDHHRLALAETPPSHLPPELARELTATCIHSELYGTRSATILAVGDGVIDYLHADGPPCTTPLADRRGLLA